jgi:flavin reductase (DIM6/NTAB) family NADH-FMN oxidoreductase RutF
LQRDARDDEAPGNGAAVLAEEESEAEQAGDSEKSVEKMHGGPAGCFPSLSNSGAKNAMAINCERGGFVRVGKPTLLLWRIAARPEREQIRVMRTLDLAKVYQKLEPGPVVLLTTAEAGRPNVMTMSWHMMVEFNPPLIACIVSEGDFSYRMLNQSGECVIAIPPAELAETVVGIGNCSGRDIDKFAHFRLKKKKARFVEAPLIEQCIVNIECKVLDRRLVPQFNLFILEGVHAWIDPERADAKTLHHCGRGRFLLDGEELRLRSAMP